MRIEQFDRHKSNQGYLAAKYPCVLSYAFAAVFLFIPYAKLLAWLIPFIFFFREKDSRYLRLHTAQSGFLLLFLALLTLLLNTSADVAFYFASRSQSETAVIEALFLGAKLDQAAWGLALASFALLLVESVLAYTYRLLPLPLLGRMAARLEERTRPGPLR